MKFRKNLEPAPAKVTRRCTMKYGYQGVRVEIKSAHHPYTWIFHSRPFQQVTFWEAERRWTEDGAVARRDTPKRHGDDGELAWRHIPEMLDYLEPWLTLEFGNVLEGALGAAVLRDVLHWAADYAVPADGLDERWPEELGQGIYVSG